MKSATSLGKREIRVAINPQSVCRMAVYGASVNQASHSKRGESRSSTRCGIGTGAACATTTNARKMRRDILGSEGIRTLESLPQLHQMLHYCCLDVVGTLRMMVVHWWAGSHVGRQLAIAGHHSSDSFCRANLFHDPITPPGSNAHRKSDRKLKIAVRIPLTRTNLDTKAIVTGKQIGRAHV